MSVNGQNAGWVTAKHNGSAAYWRRKHTNIPNVCCKSDYTILYKEHTVRNYILI